MSRILGILGGMGPLASAEFIKTIYEYNLASNEQDMPSCILYSDPTIPDRTQAIQQHEAEQVIARLQFALQQLSRLDVARIVIPCITAHFFLPAIRPDLRGNVLSLIDVVVDDVLKAQQPHLLFCTNGTREAGIFQRSARWPDVERYIVLPTDSDQQRIHALLYQVKQGKLDGTHLDQVEHWLAAYQVRGLIAGCTEMHILTKRLVARAKGAYAYQIADPLLTIAQNWPAMLDSQQHAHHLSSA